ncbi:MAG: cation transporter [Chloroflexi bacterium]|nr:cation transporter [Chloroflexota bacterium]
MSDPKASVAGLSVISNLALTFAKFGAGILTGSISVLAEAVHSLMDLAASAITFFSVKVSGHPADREHPFGHGKVESISGLIEAGLIFVAAGLILYQSVQRLLTGVGPRETFPAIVIMLLSVVVNTIVSRKLLKVARSTESIALEADSAHLYTDVYTSLGVLLGLLVVEFTPLKIFDSIAAAAVALLILRAGWKITRKAIRELMDVKLPAEEEAIIRAAIVEHGREVVGFHELRTRRVGSQRDIDLHLVMSKDASLKDAHAMCDHLEQDIQSKLRDATINIHVEPCGATGCEQCKTVCIEKGKGKVRPGPQAR